MRKLLLLTLASALSAAELEIRVIYDNTISDAGSRIGMEEDWGFSAVVTFQGRRLLFDSGTKPELFLKNLDLMEVEPESILSAMISHEHKDHRSGVMQLKPLAPRLPVHFLETFEKPAWDDARAAGFEPVPVKAPRELLSGMFTTGLIEGKPNEQALVVETPKGIVVVVGCSHPGVVKMVRAAEKQLGHKRVRLLIGGFHMFQQTEQQITEQIEQLRSLGVEEIRPAHCTGEKAHALFKKHWGTKYGEAGAGRVIRLD